MNFLLFVFLAWLPAVVGTILFFATSRLWVRWLQGLVAQAVDGYVQQLRAQAAENPQAVVQFFEPFVAPMLNHVVSNVGKAVPEAVAGGYTKLFGVKIPNNLLFGLLNRFLPGGLGDVLGFKPPKEEEKPKREKWVYGP